MTYKVVGTYSFYGELWLMIRILIL